MNENDEEHPNNEAMSAAEQDMANANNDAQIQGNDADGGAEVEADATE